MNDQDKRAVEGLARSGIDLKGLCEAFPTFPQDEIEIIYEYIQGILTGKKQPEIKRNCS